MFFYIPGSICFLLLPLHLPSSRDPSINGNFSPPPPSISPSPKLYILLHLLLFLFIQAARPAPFIPSIDKTFFYGGHSRSLYGMAQPSFQIAPIFTQAKKLVTLVAKAPPPSVAWRIGWHAKDADSSDISGISHRPLLLLLVIVALPPPAASRHRVIKLLLLLLWSNGVCMSTFCRLRPPT